MAEKNQTELNFNGPSGAAPRPCLTVTQLTTRIKSLLEMQVGEVWVRGEISGYRPASSGHLYFSLKDSGSVLSCAFFRSAGRLKFEPKDGLEVIVHGRVSVYPPRGNYQLIIDQIEPVGAGSLQLAFEQLKARLLKEGLFDPARKRAIPPHPAKIAIITSPTGAALQDMLNVLGRRNAGISILVVPALVQGDAACPQLVRGIEVVNQFDLAEVIVLARGGGSMEDLWCFNDEKLVRAIVASRIPVISAVGHEIDFTLADFAADLRAPTPSAAAELVSRNRLELIEALSASERRLVSATSGWLARFKSQLLSLENRLVSPVERLVRLRKILSELELRAAHAIEGKVPVLRQMTDELGMRIGHSIERFVTERRRRMELFSGRLEALSPLKVLGRGYTLVEELATGTLVKSAAQATPGKEVALVFHDGRAEAKIK